MADLRRPGPDAAKRLLDITGATLLALLAAPVMLVAAVAIRLDSPGPVLFKPRRVGRDGRLFTMYKFRTMCVDAEERLVELAARNLGGDRLIRIPDDPRVTRVGRFLRRTDLDELPQLLNVVKGDMSLVGPRPQAPNEVALYDERERRRLKALPGITGLWQVTARSSADFEDWVRLDLEYIRRRNLALDLWILSRTAASAVSGLLQGDLTQEVGREEGRPSG